MGFVNLFTANRRNKANTAKQGPSVRELGISSPLPLVVSQTDPYTDIDLVKQGGLKRAPFVHRAHEFPPLEAHLVQRHHRISCADFDCDSDLSLQARAHRMGGLYPEDEVREADSGYGTDKHLETKIVSTPDEVQVPESSSIGKTPSSKKPKKEPFEGRIELLKIGQNGNELLVSGIFGSVAQRPSVPQRNPLRKASLIPSDISLLSFTQNSDATLCGSIKSNGKYEIEESNFKKDFWWVKDVGEGGFGKVELRKHKKTGQLLVLKTTRTVVEHIGNVPAEVYIIRDILGNVHDNLPKLFHFNHSFAQLEYWMEYCDGGDIVTFMEYHLLNNTLVPEGFLWHTLISLTSALAFLHTGVDRSDPDRPPPPKWQPIIHRDIKPDNIFLKLSSSHHPHPPANSNNYNYATPNHPPKIPYPTLTLGDFGLATTSCTASKDSKNYFIGTPAYQPPQTPFHSLQSDIWAAGAIIHFLATASPPIKCQPYYDSRSLDTFECDPHVREVADIRSLKGGKVGDGGSEGGKVGYSATLKEYLDYWLCWDERDRPLGLRGVLRAEAGRLMFLADGGVEAGVGGWEEWVRGGGAGVARRTGRGAKGF